MRPSEMRTMSRTPGFHQLLRDRQHAPFRHAGSALGTGILEHDDVVGRDVEVVALDLARHVIVVLEGERRPAVLEKALVGRGRLHDAAARRQVAGKHRGRAFGIDRIGERMDDVAQIDLGAGDVLAHRPARHRQTGQVELVARAPASARASRRHRRNPPSGICRTGARWRAPGSPARSRRSAACRARSRRGAPSPPHG